MRNDNAARTRTFSEFLFTADESKSGTNPWIIVHVTRLIKPVSSSLATRLIDVIEYPSLKVRCIYSSLNVTDYRIIISSVARK